MSKLQGLREGEFIGINCWPVVPGMKKISEEKEKELILSCLKDGIGRGHIVQKGNQKYTAVLMDIDFETDPSNKRYIFSYFNEHQGIDITVDTLYDSNWVVYDISAELL